MNSVKITDLMNIKYNEHLLNNEYLIGSLYDFQGHTVHCIIKNFRSVSLKFCLPGQKSLGHEFGIPLVTLKY